MKNAREIIDKLIESLEGCCLLYIQLISEYNKLHRIESKGGPAKPTFSAVDGKPDMLIVDQAYVSYEAKLEGPSLAIHKTEEDLRAAIDEAKRAIQYPNLVTIINPIVDKPAKWLADLLGEVESMYLTSHYLYERVDEHAAPTSMNSTKIRMQDFTAIAQKHGHLEKSLKTGWNPTTSEHEKTTVVTRTTEVKKHIARWYFKATDGDLNAETLRKAKDRGAIKGDKPNGRWHYTVESVCREWPKYKILIHKAIDSDKSM